MGEGSISIGLNPADEDQGKIPELGEPQNTGGFFSNTWGSFIFGENDEPDEMPVNNINLSGSWLRPMFYEDDYSGDPVTQAADGAKQPDDMYPIVKPVEIQTQEQSDKSIKGEPCKPCQAAAEQNTAVRAAEEYRLPDELYYYDNYQPYPVVMDYTAPAAPQYNPYTSCCNAGPGGYVPYGQTPAVLPNLPTGTAVAPNCGGIKIPDAVLFLLLIRMIYMWWYPVY